MKRLVPSVNRWRAIWWGLIFLGLPAWRDTVLAEPGPGQTQGDYVVLLHGLGRTAWSMKRIEWGLAREGYRVINLSYPSTQLSIEQIANGWLSALLQDRVGDRAAKIHFVTHSLGGIVLRQYLSEREVANLGRVVMLAPPNQGSELADRLERNWVYKRLTGPAGQQLGTGPASLPRQLGPASCDLGIIAGARSLNPLFSAWIPGHDDGKVSVESARLEGMKELRVVPHSHTWMMWRRNVTAAIGHFLESGKFPDP